jgi:predicted amidohydrolase
LLVFPEALMTKFEGSIEQFVVQAQPSDGPFAQAIDSLAADNNLWIAYTVNERNPNGGLPFNTAIITDAEGHQRARYRKVHLFDAQGYRESDRMTAGNELMTPLDTPFACLGLGICYDLRFPEVALGAAQAGAQIMLYPAAWVDGPYKVEQWETLLRARAIENGLFVAGVCSADPNRIGHSCVFAPDGALLALGADRAEDLVICDIDLSIIERVRSTTPSLEHRRPELYAG